MYTYYDEVSYGQLKLVQGNAPLFWVLSSAPNKAYYGKDRDYLAGLIDDFNGPIYELVKEAIALSDDQIDFSEYDNDGPDGISNSVDDDGVVDHLLVVPAGLGEEQSHTPATDDTIWSHRWDIGGDEGGPPGKRESQLDPGEVIYQNEVMYETDDDAVNGGKIKINGYALTSELSPLGIFCHEFGHELGLPDLYNTASRGSGVGEWDLMDIGCWNPNNTGASPSHLCAWCKKQLKWVTPEEIQGSESNLPVYPLENISRHDVYKIPIEVSDHPNQEYFLISYRKRTGYDSALPGQGLMVWHIDDSVGQITENNVNNNPEHRRVDLEGPGKTSPPAIGSPFTDGDIFEEPASNAYNGEISKIGIFDLLGAGENYMSININKVKFAEQTEVSEAINYPNPTEQETTITFTLTRPSPERSIHIYDLAGDLVKEVPAEEIESDVEHTEDYKISYKYHWNGGNDDGDLVCPGIYLYLIKARDTKTDKIIKKVGKLVILR